MKRLCGALYGILFFTLSMNAIGIWSQRIGIDLGTRNSLVVQNENGDVTIRANIPSAVCYERDSERILCFGQKALQKIGKSPDGIIATRPLKDGVIYSLKSAKALIRAMLQSADVQLNWLTRTSMVIGIPCAVKAGDCVAIENGLKELGASDVLLVKEPIAAAIDAGLDIGGDTVHMVIDIGGGTTDILAIAQYGAIAQNAITTAGDEMDQAIVDYVREHFHLSIDEETAQEIKCKIGAVWMSEQHRDMKMEVSGMDILHQIPRTITISTQDTVKALEYCTETILDGVHAVIRTLPHRASGDIAQTGIVLVGGGALLEGMKDCFEQRFAIPVTIPNDPLISVARGIGKIVGDYHTYRRVLQNPIDDF